MNFSFRTTARTVDLLGRQQIAGIPTAIQELVKNSYDAYAKQVDIDYFEESNSLVIADDGCGMTADEFVRKWLTLGTSSRVSEATKGTYEYEKRKQTGRPVTGEKGIGRLAVASLGNVVLVFSRAKIEAQLFSESHFAPIVVAAIHWGQFELPYITLDKIEVPIRCFEKFPTAPDIQGIYEDLKGTLIKTLYLSGDTRLVQEAELEISNAERSIDKILPTIAAKLQSGTGTAFLVPSVDSVFGSDIAMAERGQNDEVSTMMQTLTGFSDALHECTEAQVMQIRLRSHKSDGTYVSFLDKEDFFTKDDLEVADHRFIGKFDEHGIFKGDIYIYGKKVAENYVIDCAANCKGTMKCGPFDLVLGYLQGNKRQSILDPIQHERLNQKLKRFGGLYIYRDGVRILPYGRADYDFLGLESDRIKRASRYFFSYHRMFGSVAITKEDNGALTEKAGREGLIENVAYRQFKSVLKNFFRNVSQEFFDADAKSDGANGFWAQHRRQLEESSAILKDNERAIEHKRKAFCRKLATFFGKIESGAYKCEIERILDGLVMSLHGTQHSVSDIDRENDLSAEKISTLQRKAMEGLRKIEKDISIKYPIGVSLTIEQREDWGLYLKESERILSEVLGPAKKRLSAIISNYLANGPVKATYDELVGKIVQDTLHSASLSIERRLMQVMALIDDLRRRFANWERKAEFEFGQLSNESLNKKITQDEISDLNAAIERRLQIPGEKAEEIIQVIEYLQGELLPISWGQGKHEKVVTTQDAIAALSEENQDLKSQRLSDVELVQLGLAAKAFHHEFNGAVLQARAAIRDLEGFTNGDSHYKEAVKTLSMSFQHLEQYVTMITPFASRVQNAEEPISGLELFKFLCEAFRDELRKNDIVIETSQGFLKYNSVGHRAVYFPVVFNLVDNAIYWLKKSDVNGRKTILLHATAGGNMSVSNNGEPIAYQDRERVFNMGFTRKVGGRGMGLAISREILRKDGFEISIIDPIRTDMKVTFEIRRGIANG